MRLERPLALAPRSRRCHRLLRGPQGLAALRATTAPMEAHSDGRNCQQPAFVGYPRSRRADRAPQRPMGTGSTGCRRPARSNSRSNASGAGWTNAGSITNPGVECRHGWPRRTAPVEDTGSRSSGHAGVAAVTGVRFQATERHEGRKYSAWGRLDPGPAKRRPGRCRHCDAVAGAGRPGRGVKDRPPAPDRVGYCPASPGPINPPLSGKASWRLACWP